jgi:Tfp pilus assembly protein PilX
MNTKLKIALIRRYSDQGFALPIAMGMGLIMLLIAATLIMRSHGDQTTALAQKATNRGLSAAETGITRYQSFINNNRVTATYKDCEGTRNSSGTCPDTGSTKSWTNATAVPGISSCSGGSGATAVANNSTVAWQDVNSSDSSLGQYRLVSYVYPAPGTTGTVGTAPGTGQLTVEGRVNQTGSGSTATQGVSTATTRLQVNIPVLQPTLSGIPVPGAWITTGGTGGNTIDGNVLLNDCTVALSSINIEVTNSVTGQPNSKSYTSMSFPALPTKPTFITSPKNQVLGTINSSTMSGLGATSIDESGGGGKGGGGGGGGSHLKLTLPRSGDTANGSGVYEYSVTSIDLPNNWELVVTPGQKVKLYLDGGITKGGDIKHDCSGVSGCKPTDFQIFGYGPSGTQICMNGNNYIEAFIFAPEYTVGVAGAGGGAGGIKGTVWVKNWSNSTGCGSGTSNTVVVQNAEWADIGLTPQNLPPTIASASSWKRQESP